MAHIVADRVLESTVTTGTGALALDGAVTGFRAFSAVCAVSDTVQYFIEAVDALGQPTGDYEYGLGTYTAADELTRTTVQGSSNAGAAVNFSAGSKNVGIGLAAASFAASLGSSGYQKLPGGLTFQWGQATFVGATGNITFPVAFPVACVFFGASDIGSTAPFQGVAGTLTTTGANTVTFASSPATFYWFAVGF